MNKRETKKDKKTEEIDFQERLDKFLDELDEVVNEGREEKVSKSAILDALLTSTSHLIKDYFTKGEVSLNDALQDFKEHLTPESTLTENDEELETIQNESSVTWTPEYVNELAEKLLEGETLSTLSPMPDELKEQVERRVQELQNVPEPDPMAVPVEPQVEVPGTETMPVDNVPEPDPMAVPVEPQVEVPGTETMSVDNVPEPDTMAVPVEPQVEVPGTETMPEENMQTESSDIPMEPTSLEVPEVVTTPEVEVSAVPMEPMTEGSNSYIAPDGSVWETEQEYLEYTNKPNMGEEIPTPGENVSSPEVPMETVPGSDMGYQTIDPLYIDELARQAVSNGDMQSVETLPDNLKPLVMDRIKELSSSSMQIPNEALTQEVTPDPSTMIMQAPSYYISPDGTQWNTEADYVNYIDYMARYYLTYGNLNTPTPLSEGLLAAINQRIIAIQSEQAASQRTM